MPEEVIVKIQPTQELESILVRVIREVIRMAPLATGGPVSAPRPEVIDPEECLIRWANIAAGTVACSRSSHEGRTCQKELNDT